MNPNPHNPKPSACDSGEETLRIIAHLPAPAGLEDRVHTALRGAHRSARVLAWPKAVRPQSAWMRTAAAATIVFAVVGGGWGVYTRVQQNLPAKVIVMPPRIGAPGGFSGAGAVRTPDTLTGPIVNPIPKASAVTNQPAVQQTATKAAPSKTAKKAVAGAVPVSPGMSQDVKQK
jgi:hypothetical protein